MAYDPNKPPAEMSLSELGEVWDHLDAIEKFCTIHFKYKGTAQSTLGKVRRQLADEIAKAVARDRLARS